MNPFLKLAVLALVTAPLAGAFPSHRSLGGLSSEQLDRIFPTLKVAPPEGPPPPQDDTSTRLVDDADHPFMPAGPNDMRGPCPGLNTLASHGVIYLFVYSQCKFTSVMTVPAPEWNCNSRSSHQCYNARRVIYSFSWKSGTKNLQVSTWSSPLQSLSHTPHSW